MKVAAWPLVMLALLPGCAQTTDPTTTQTVDACSVAVGLPPVREHALPALAGDVDVVARRIASSLEDQVVAATAWPDDGTRPAVSVLGHWNTTAGSLTAFVPAAEPAAATPDHREWLYTTARDWPDPNAGSSDGDDDDAGQPARDPNAPPADPEVTRASLQEMLDDLTGPTPWPLVVGPEHAGQRLITQGFPGTDYRLWVGAWIAHHGTRQPATLQILDEARAYADVPGTVANLTATAQAYVSCRLYRDGTTWAAPFMQMSNATMRGLSISGRPALYVSWEWAAGHPPQGCTELALFDVQVDAMTGRILSAHNPTKLAACPPG